MGEPKAVGGGTAGALLPREPWLFALARYVAWALSYLGLALGLSIASDAVGWPGMGWPGALLLALFLGAGPGTYGKGSLGGTYRRRSLWPFGVPATFAWVAVEILLDRVHWLPPDLPRVPTLVAAALVVPLCLWLTSRLERHLQPGRVPPSERHAQVHPS